MYTSRSAIKVLAVIFVSVFLVSFLTVELDHSKTCPWFKYPGFLENDCDVALAGTQAVTIECVKAAEFHVVSRPNPFIAQTTLFLHIYRGPPSLQS
jgi:hypothetical protein